MARVANRAAIIRPSLILITCYGRLRRQRFATFAAWGGWPIDQDTASWPVLRSPYKPGIHKADGWALAGTNPFPWWELVRFKSTRPTVRGTHPLSPASAYWHDH